MIDYKLFDTFQDAVLVLDEEGRVVYGNVAATFLLEVSAKRLSSGKPLAQYVEFSPAPYENLKSVNEATQLREVAYTASSGKAGWIQVVVHPQPDFFSAASTDEAEKNRWILALRDVSLEKTLHDKYKAELDKKEAVINDLRAARSKLEDYSKNLEQMVADRTAELTKTNVLLRTILDSLGQGILVFGSDGLTLPVYSQICEKLFGESLAGRPIENVLGFESDEASVFANWREAVFAEMLDFTDLTPLAPNRLPLPAPTEIALSYNRMVSEQGATAGVVVVATDRTAEVAAIRLAERERALVKKVVQVARHKEAFRLFVLDAKELLAELSTGIFASREELERRLHTLKGGAATFALANVAHVCHDLETHIKTIEIESAEFKLELKLRAHEMLTSLNAELEELNDLLGPLGREERGSGDPALKVYIAPYQNSVLELAERLGKKVAPLEIEGGDIRVSQARFRPLLGSLVHAFRNAVDHGIETPEERVASGKPELAKLLCASTISGNDLVIEISDDGRGVNVERLREKLRSHPTKSAWASASDEEITQLILEGDLSTASAVTDVSGRGVGLSAIADEARKLGGQMRVESVVGQGTKFVIVVPLEERVSQLKAS
jgi:two-component system, chemotaxis family, sensor kinase CheA